MVPSESLIRATESPWTWLLQCWRLRGSVRRLAQDGQVQALKDELHLVRLELNALKAAREREGDALKVAKMGNQALLRFIHTGHRLNVKFDPDSIRAALQRAQQP